MASEQSRVIVAVGGSAGALQALMHLAQRLPADFPAAVLCVLHIRAQESALPQLINRVASMPAGAATDGERLRESHIYIAPPDQHMILEDGSIVLTKGAREHGFRPAIDPLFRAAAAAHGARVIGVLLSGALDDGVTGLAGIKRHGGIAVVQNPEEATFPSMPATAIQKVSVDHVVSVADMPQLLSTLADRIRQEKPSVQPAVTLSAGEINALKVPSGFTCPDCGGILWEERNGGGISYECRVGHRYSPESLVETHGTHLEGTLWAALRTLEERASMFRRMASQAREAGRSQRADRYDEGAREFDQHAVNLRGFVERINLQPQPRVPAAALPKPEAAHHPTRPAHQDEEP